MVSCCACHIMPSKEDLREVHQIYLIIVPTNATASWGAQCFRKCVATKFCMVTARIKMHTGLECALVEGAPGDGAPADNHFPGGRWGLS